MDTIVGQNLGQYHIIEEIAQGGMSTVYRATQTSIGRDVAVKVLPQALLHDTKFLERFNREVDVVAHLQHPHILPVYDFGDFQGIPYVVMAYLRGGTLGDYIQKQGPLPLDELLRLVRQIVDALDYAHSKGIIHRDFKPSNVLLDEQRNTYLADFGLAKIMEGSTHLTGSMMLGTPMYMAPELANLEAPTKAVDIYALGITLFQMLTGRLPYETPTPAAAILAHVTQPIPMVNSARPDLPAGIQNVIDRAMAKAPADRFKTAGELLEALSEAIGVSSAAPAADSQNALLMTNMLGQIIFVDQLCLKLLRRPLQDARAVMGKSLAETLGIDSKIASKLVEDVRKNGEVIGLDMMLKDAKGGTVAVFCSATATFDSQKAFVGMDVTLKPYAEASGPDQRTPFPLNPVRMDTAEESIFQVYFTAQLQALNKLLMQLGGKRFRDHMEGVLNETAQRNVWPIAFEDGQVIVEPQTREPDIYRALLAKARTYAISLIGEKVVLKELKAVDDRMDPKMLERVKEIGIA
ncbi:MAG TPA: serine/threonine-protein kinase [Aggregatilineales bacterium]|nr:serine/threonine-protein kinase [Aggregatilineales bacterium]